MVRQISLLALAMLAIGILACGNGKSPSPAEGWVSASFLAAISEAERSCLDRGYSTEEYQTMISHRDTIAPTDLEAISQAFDERTLYISAVWDECVRPESDVLLVLEFFESTYGEPRPEVEDCIRKTWADVQLNPKAVMVAYEGIYTRYTSVASSHWTVFPECVTEIEEQIYTVRTFAERFGRDLLTEAEIDCVRQAVADDEYLYASDLDVSWMDHPAYRCITPERFGEIYAVDWEKDRLGKLDESGVVRREDLPFKLGPWQLDCVQGLLAEKYAALLTKARDLDPEEADSVSIRSGLFDAAIAYTCYSTSQLYTLERDLQEAILEAGGQSLVEDLGVSINEWIRCQKKLTEFNLEAYRTYGWAFVLEQPEHLDAEGRKALEGLEESYVELCPFLAETE